MIENIFLGSNDYKITSYNQHNNKVNINIVSKIKSCRCPRCGQKCKNNHCIYVRHIQDTPIHNKETWLHVSVNEFDCTNENCEIKTFSETLPFARKNKVKTDALIQFILSVSMFLSSNSASLILSFLGVKASADVIDDIIHNIKITDNPDVEEVGIDDVAIRKGQTYATAIYDMKDHHLIALLDGRDSETLEKWLKDHNKINTIARDRAGAYAKAINKVLPECIQIADRFHLFQNLIGYLKNIFYNQVPEKIFIKENKILESKELKKIPVEINKVNQDVLNKLNYDNTKPIDEYGNEIIFDIKKRDLDSKQYKTSEKKRFEKKEKIKRIRNKVKEVGLKNIKEISLEYKLSIPTIRKYKNMTDVEVEKISNINEFKKSKTLMDDYINIVYKMIKDNISCEYIMAYIIKCGYKGSIRNLKDYIKFIAKNNNLPYKKIKPYVNIEYPKDVIIITRCELLKYILTIDDKKKNKEISKYINIIKNKYPVLNEVKDIFYDFRETIFSNDEENLDIFIEIYQDKIPSFCNGLKKDITAVKHAISHKISSGFVEGNNNKFKLIKRIVYGKQKLINLFKKNYLCFLATTDNFSIEDVIDNILN